MQERESEVAQSCPTPCDPVDCSLPGSSIHGIFQARVLEWGAIAFSTEEAHITMLKHTLPSLKGHQFPPRNCILGPQVKEWGRGAEASWGSPHSSAVHPPV